MFRLNMEFIAWILAFKEGVFCLGRWQIKLEQVCILLAL